jgi:hypothetical protein
VAQVLGILLFHRTLAEVVWVQVIVMAALFTLLLIYNFLSHQRETAANLTETL